MGNLGEALRQIERRLHPETEEWIDSAPWRPEWEAAVRSLLQGESEVGSLREQTSPTSVGRHIDG